MTRKRSKTRRPQMVVTGKDWLARTAPMVYAWKRGDRYLYIGATVRGFARLYSHDVVNVAEPVLEDDVFEIWLADRDMRLIELEAFLIHIHQPTYNVTGTKKTFSGKSCETVECRICHNKFQQAYNNQYRCLECLKPSFQQRAAHERKLAEQMVHDAAPKHGLIVLM